LSASLIRLDASGTRMPWGSCHASGFVAPAVCASDIARSLCFLALFRREGLPRSMIDDSDIFLLCDEDITAIGSRLSTRGDPRLDAGEAALNGLMNVVGGVGRGMAFGDRRMSIALRGVFPPEVMDAGVMSCVLLAFEFSMRGAGEPLRSTAGDFGGTCGGISESPVKLAVSTFSSGFGLVMGLIIGDSGFVAVLGVSEIAGVFCWESLTGEGPVTQDTMASPNGPARQFVPGALQDLSWPKVSCDS
jgi:hypothetical protein